MPPPPGPPSRHRKAIVPFAKLNHRQRLKRSQSKGLELLNGATALRASPSSIMATLGSSSKKALTILDLPPETLKDIFQFVLFRDLVALSLVSKHFRDVAAAQLYRTFHIVFPGEHDIGNDALIDGLAGGLDTFVTAEYDYAKHVREITLECLSGGDKGERECLDYSYNVSCGKFMNTLFLLTLRKTKVLETFRWDIRVEVSREVFKTLHGIDSLRNIHLRMQTGPSTYQTPPAILSSTPLVYTPVVAPQTVTNLMHTVPFPPPALQPEGFPYYSAPVPPSSGVTSKFEVVKASSELKHTKSVPTSSRKPLPTISGFKGLESLAVLDMDTLDYVTEIKECIEKSSSTLKSLNISFSDTLARKSRKPPPEFHSDDDSDMDDGFGQPVPLPGLPPGPAAGASDPSGPSKVLKAQEEKKKQEAVLGNIFNIAPEIVKVLPIDLPEIKPVVENPTTRFIKNLAPIAKLLMSSTVHDGHELSAEGQAALELITKAAKIYLETADKSDGSAGQNSSGNCAETSGSPSDSTPKATPMPSATSNMDGAIVAESTNSEPGLFDDSDKNSKTPISSDSSSPEDIDIEEPEVVERFDSIDDNDEFEALKSEVKNDRSEHEISHRGVKEIITAEAKTSLSNDEKKVVIATPNGQQLVANLTALVASHGEIKREFAAETEKMQNQIESFQLKGKLGTLQTSDYTSLAEAEASYRQTASRVSELSKKVEETKEHLDDLEAAELRKLNSEATKMSDYVRLTRGLTLRDLAIYLIPIKASVLSRAIDISVLQSITLLNVGHQTPFWTAVAKVNQTSPIPLKRIYTDNVTIQFLALVNKLERVEELLLLERARDERTQKRSVEPTTPKTIVTFEQIRKIVLKKHARNFKVLMIRNDLTEDWDLDIKGAILLCQRAKALEELAVKYNFNTMHTIFQFMPGLVSLRALHTLEFRRRETCLWIMQEFRKFAVDIISHNPEMKLEYLALDTSVERLVRTAPSKAAKPLIENLIEKELDKKAKSKGKENSKGKTLAQLAQAQNMSWSSTSGVGFRIGKTPLDITNGTSTAGLLSSWEEEDSDDEDLDVGGTSGLKVETVRGIPFYEIDDVRIFEKDVLFGRL